MVSMDRYLSTTLGLPYASSLPYAKTPEQLIVFAPIDRMARLQCVVAERLLDRPKDDINEVFEIDRLLLEAAAQMPHDWWLTPDLRRNSATAAVDLDQDRVVARFNYQLSHYHLLLRLYLPYIFLPRRDADYGHGKRIALSASREILLRYHAFRTWNQSRYYCRGMDFLALIALTVLCVVHIDARAQQETSVTHTHTPHELAHSHPVDRGMMQRTFELMQGLNHDETASKLSDMMQSLLEIERETTVGTQYSATAVYNGDGTTEYLSEVLDNGRQLRLRIPYFGTIMLQRHPTSVPTNGSSAINGHATTDTITFHNSLDWSGASLQEALTCDDWTLQTVNQALFQDLFGGASTC
ncbi:hypothetical protein E8E12_010443 [Didymella heteroderae]|uniref:Uncharacterized protein n=1 Tax=Didymella heteroderae TaxID=1769908 RepID=A0A9P4WXB2_9PLEO|nr:hypothetical protein E8E12_010443 [Didymella heteroderae]